MKEQVCSLQQMEKQLFKLNERVIDYSDLVQSYVIFPLIVVPLKSKRVL